MIWYKMKKILMYLEVEGKFLPDIMTWAFLKLFTISQISNDHYEWMKEAFISTELSNQW